MRTSFATRSDASHSMLRRRGGLLLLLAFIALVVIALTTFFRAGKTINHIERQTEINQVVPALNALLVDVLSAETGQRGYLLTGRTSYLASYQEALGDYRQELSALLASPHLISSDRKRLKRIQALLELKFEELAVTIRLHQQGEFVAARNVVLTDQGQAYRQELQDLLQQMTREQVGERDALARELSREARRTRELIVVGVTLLLLFAGLALWQLKKVLGENARLVNELDREATHCPLTGLYNRRYFEERLRHEVTAAQRHGDSVALLFLDLDRFKQVNDLLGHEAGDRLLQALSTKLKDTVRASDLVFRLAGDEFAVLAMERANEAPQLEALAQRLIDAVRSTAQQPPWNAANVGVSIGIAAYPRNALSAQALLEAADQAMYDAKSAGKGQARFAQGARAEATCSGPSHLAPIDSALYSPRRAPEAGAV